MKKQVLLEAIKKVKPAISDGKLIEFKGLIIFDGEKLISYGDNISISVPLKTDFIAAIQEEKFTKLIEKSAVDEISLSLEEDQLIVGAEGKAGFSLISYDPKTIPDLGLAQVKEWNKFPEGFIDALKFCIFSAANDSSYGSMCNLYVAKDRIISSDNYRISEKILKSEMTGLLDNKLLISRKIASFLSAFKIIEYALTESCAHYKDENGVVFTHRVIVDDYPSLEEFLNVEGRKIQLPKALSGALNRAQSILSKDEDKVTVKIAKKFINVFSEGKGAWFKEPVSAPDYDGDELKFDVSPEHMIQILEFSTDVIIGENILLFAGNDFRHSVCLINE